MPLLPQRPTAIVTVAAAVAGLTSFSLSTAGSAQAASTTVTISEVFGGGGNSGAPLRSDFV